MHSGDFIVLEKIGSFMDQGIDPPYTLSNLGVDSSCDLKNLRDEGLVRILIKDNKHLVWPTEKLLEIGPGYVEDANLDYFSLDSLKLTDESRSLLSQVSGGPVSISSLSLSQAESGLIPIYYSGLVGVDDKTVFLTKKGKHMLEGGLYSPTQSTTLETGWPGPLRVEKLDKFTTDSGFLGLPEKAIVDTSIEDLIKSGYDRSKVKEILRLVDLGVLSTEGKGKKTKLKVTSSGRTLLDRGWLLSSHPYGQGKEHKRLARHFKPEPGGYSEYFKTAPELTLEALMAAYIRSGDKPVRADQVASVGNELGQGIRTPVDERSGGNTVFSYTDRTQRWLRRLVKKGKARETRIGGRYYYEPVEG